MTTIAAITIISCTLIICVFAFFTIVYISELKREKQLRNILLDENKKMQELIGGTIPVVLIDPSKKEKDVIAVSKDKKNIN